MANDVNPWQFDDERLEFLIAYKLYPPFLAYCAHAIAPVVARMTFEVTTSENQSFDVELLKELYPSKQLV